MASRAELSVVQPFERSRGLQVATRGVAHLVQMEELGRAWLSVDESRRLSTMEKAESVPMEPKRTASRPIGEEDPQVKGLVKGARDRSSSGVAGPHGQ